MKGHQMYGNTNGLPGLPKTTYVAIGNRRPAPTRSQMRTVPPPAPMISRPRLAPAPLPRPAPIMIPQGPDPTLSRRIDTVESRIISTEQSNRTLLDELMRLQTEIKGNVRRNELSIQEERDARSRLEMGIRQSQQKNYDSEERLKRCEDGVKDNRGAVQQLSIHVNNIEKMIDSLKQDHMEARGGSSRQLTDYKNDISRISADNDQLERIVKNVQGDNKDNAGRIDRLVADVAVLSNQLRLQTKLMEENAKKPVPASRAEPGVDPRIIDNERANTDAKIMQLNRTIQELSERLREESAKREQAEQFYKNKLNSLTGELSNSKVERDKKQNDYDQKMADINNGFNETDKRQMKVEMSRISNDLNEKIAKNDEKLRGETLGKLNVIEKTLKDELAKIGDNHTHLHHKIDSASNELLKNKDSHKADLDTAFDKQSKKHNDVLKELNERMNDVEEAFRSHKLEQEKVLESEISERLKNDKILDAKIDDLEDDVQLGFVTIQNQLTDPDRKKKKSSKESTKSSPNIDYDEIKTMQEENANGVRKQVAKDIGAIEGRIAALETELRQKEDRVHNKLESSKAKEKEKAAVMGDNLQQQIDALIIKHGKLKKQVDNLSSQIEDTPKSLQAFKEQATVSLEELTAGLKKERESRKANVEEINKDIDKIVGQKDQGDIPSLAQLNLDVDQTQTGLKKCAESIHVVKKILTEKVSDEKKLREKEFAILTSDVDRLDTKIKDLKERVKGAKGTNDPALDDEDFL